MKVMLERGQTPLRKYLRTLLKMNQVSILRGFIKFMIMMIYLGADVDQNDLQLLHYLHRPGQHYSSPADWTMT